MAETLKLRPQVLVANISSLRFTSRRPGEKVQLIESGRICGEVAREVLWPRQICLEWSCLSACRSAAVHTARHEQEECADWALSPALPFGAPSGRTLGRTTRRRARTCQRRPRPSLQRACRPARSRPLGSAYPGSLVLRTPEFTAITCCDLRPRVELKRGESAQKM